MSVFFFLCLSVCLCFGLSGLSGRSSLMIVGNMGAHFRQAGSGYQDPGSHRVSRNVTKNDFALSISSAPSVPHTAHSLSGTICLSALLRVVSVQLALYSVLSIIGVSLASCSVVLSDPIFRVDASPDITPQVA
jgi:hypothetical protein